MTNNQDLTAEVTPQPSDPDEAIAELIHKIKAYGSNDNGNGITDAEAAKQIKLLLLEGQLKEVELVNLVTYRPEIVHYTQLRSKELTTAINQLKGSSLV